MELFNTIPNFQHDIAINRLITSNSQRKRELIVSYRKYSSSTLSFSIQDGDVVILILLASSPLVKLNFCPFFNASIAASLFFDASLEI